MASSSSCIAMAVVLFNPLDCLRIRWQVAGLGHSTAASAKVATGGATASAGGTPTTLIGFARHVVQQEGLVRGLWLPGVVSNALGAATARGIGMGCYPTVRDAITEFRGDAPGSKDAASMFGAGLISGGVGYGLSNPFWQMKTRVQAAAGKVVNGVCVTGTRAGQPPLYRSDLGGMASVARTEGLGSLYRGSSVLVVRGALMNSGNTLGYDFTTTFCFKHDLLSEGPVLHLAASVVAAFLSSTFSVPADVVMTRFQTGKQLGRNYSGVLDCVATMAREEGPAVFFRGWVPLFSRVAPLYVLYLPAYEQFRKMLGLDYMK